VETNRYATHVTVTEITRKVQGLGHRLETDNYFSSPNLLDDLAKTQIYCCGTVCPNRKGMSQDLGPNKMKLKQGNIQVRTRVDLTAVLWRDKCDVHVLTNMHNSPPEGNLCDTNRKAIKLQIVLD
jgi:hypothetical protein